MLYAEAIKTAFPTGIRKYIISGLLAFWTLSIVRYANERNVSENGSASILRSEGGRHLLRWVCSSECQAMDNIQKPSNPKCYTPPSRAFTSRIY
jgi:hypothetical protein